ncbi:MAG: guanylate kinase [Clostridia bacterium]|jgi:guanylate kinase|nr:guanylate kinase [Clostridia bacterium]MBQ1962495.1 guanylate kinase [Clostridia bacterium]MBQ5833206.1 guanylate kinase [Clostridia bacterium]
MEKGLMLVVSGPAGSGKGTVNGRLSKMDGYAFSVSATTRAPRPGEVDGVNYHFISREEFEERIARGDMLEHTSYCGNYYGTPLKEALEVLEEGKNLILEIEVEGAMNVKRLYPEAVLIMLLPPTFAVQEWRLRHRGTETEEVIQRRLARTREELELLGEYDYIVYNRPDCAEDCVEDIRAIVRAERCSLRRHPNAKKAYFEQD